LPFLSYIVHPLGTHPKNIICRGFRFSVITVSGNLQ
jgi:hypothetical protein